MSSQTGKRLLVIAIILIGALLVTANLVNQGTPDPADRGHASALEIQSPGADTINAWHQRIGEAQTSAQFEAIAHEVMAVTSAEAANKLMELLFDRWLEKDLPAALAFANGIENAVLRDIFLRYTLAEGGYLDFARVLDWISRQPGSRNAELTNLLYIEVGKDNPEYALKFIDLLNDGAAKEQIIRTVLEQWAQQDIATAFSWMNAQTLPPALDDMRTSLLARLIEQNPQEAGTLIRNIQTGRGKNIAARNYAEMLARTDIQNAVGWAGSLDDPDAYRVAMTAAYETWFSKESDKKLIMEQVLAESDSELRDRLINEIALDMANNNPADLAAILDRLPESSRPDVAEKTARFWKERDSRQTLNWIGTLAHGPARDRASKVMVEDFLFRGDNQSALSLAATIDDNRLRFNMVKNIAESWYQANPSEARQAIDGVSFLSEREKASIHSLVQNNSR